MTVPARYAGGATIRNMNVAHFENAFNPLRWPQTASYLWTDTYLIPPVLQPPDPPKLIQNPAGGSSAATGLPLLRSEQPAKAPSRSAWDDAKLFEGAIFAGSLYRNVLRTSLINSANQISLTYRQVECLETQGRRRFDGGIDIDFGHGTATQNGADVQVTVSKTVRFTQPEKQVDAVNRLAHVMVPLSFDFWLHAGIFE